VVRGFIGQEKGVYMNWVIIATWTTKEKTCKLKVKALKSEGTKLSGIIVS
jgi:hypothetical protein